MLGKESTMSYDSHLQTKYWEGKNLSVPCIALCVLLMMILGYLPKLPSSISQMLRPAMVILCFMFPSSFHYRFSITDKALALYLLYFLLVFLFHPITRNTAMSYGAVFLFGVFFIVLTMRPWNRREIQAILFSVAIAGAVFALILYTENPDMLHDHPYGGFTFRGAHVNDNTAAYGIVPGLLCSLALCLFHEPQSTKRCLWNVVVRIALFFSVVLCMFVIFCIGARSAFFSAVLGSVCVVFQKTNAWPNSRTKRSVRIAVLLLMIFLFVIGMNITEGTHSARLFDWEKYADSNGRDDLANEAWLMIHKKPLFGGGYDYWTQEKGSALGTHNTFLTIMVRGGYLGGLFLILFLLALLGEVLPTKNLLILSFSIEMIFHTLTESDLDYFAFIPLLIAFILLRYSSAHNCSAESVL